ncbi:hypothetical protein QUF70_19630 [Desulfobacterales bacterium HSG17]|nr:hypothetical protein [Desulfobacterales bacterium HSG17]
MLEIILAGLELYGVNLDDLLEKRQQRKAARGGFQNRIFLENVGETKIDNVEFQSAPDLIFNPVERNRLLEIIRNELRQSNSVWIASAFYSPGVTNLLISDFEHFIKKGGELKILLSTMGNITRPEHLTHISDFVARIQVKVVHPHNPCFDKNTPNTHLNTRLLLHSNY